MKLSCRLLGGLASLWALLAATGAMGQGPWHTIARDFHCLEASLGPLEKIDFESLPRDTSSCSDHGQNGQILANPLEISGVKFTDPVCLDTGFCCSSDPDSPAPGNNVLMLNPGGRIDLLRGPGSVILAVEGMGSNPFRLRATDFVGSSVEASTSAEPFGVIFVAFTSPVRLSRIQIVDVGGNGGPLVLAAVFFRQPPWEAPTPDCLNTPPADLAHVRPKATGTIRFLPELGILEAAPVGSSIQSSYSKTTTDNREFRRGYLEFAVPEIKAEILAAALIVREFRMVIIDAPLPPDPYEISYYSADLAVTTADFGRSTTPLDSFETDVNQAPAEFAFEITSLIREFRGKNLGFQIKLAFDPLQDQGGWNGTYFGSLWDDPPFLEIITRELFLRGDASADARVDLSDPITILQSVFGSGPPMLCEKSADVDDSGVLDVTDAVYLLDFQFQGGPAPREPFGKCGDDVTPDDLTCASVPPCP